MASSEFNIHFFISERGLIKMQTDKLFTDDKQLPLRFSNMAKNQNDWPLDLLKHEDELNLNKVWK